jgi:hypothetical protein
VKLLILLLAVGCARNPQKFDLTFDPCTSTKIVLASDVSAGDRASVEDAIAMWQAVAPVKLSLDAVGPDERSQTLPLVFERAASAFYGIYEDTIPQISINSDLTDGGQRAIAIAHELGHAMDLYHVYDRPSVMNTPNLKTPPEASDAAELVATWGDCVSGGGGR